MLPGALAIAQAKPASTDSPRAQLLALLVGNLGTKKSRRSGPIESAHPAACGWKASEDILSNLLNLELAEREAAEEKMMGT